MSEERVLRFNPTTKMGVETAAEQCKFVTNALGYLAKSRPLSCFEQYLSEEAELGRIPAGLHMTRAGEDLSFHLRRS